MRINTMRRLKRNRDASGDSESSHLSTVSNKTKHKQVHFSTVSVREYDRVVGDNPSVREGPPLSIGWKYKERELVDLDDYEWYRISKGNYPLSPTARQNMLQNVFQVSPDEIRNAETKVRLVKVQRNNTAQQGKAGETIEAILESAKRKLKRGFSSGKLEHDGSQSFVSRAHDDTITHNTIVTTGHEYNKLGTY